MSLQAAADTIARWRRDPIAFVRENFGVEPDAWQRDVLLAFADETDPRKARIAMQACAGPGKSAVLAWCGWHFLATRGSIGNHPVGYAISITGDNLRDNLWKEFAKWRDRSEFLKAAFEWTAEKIFAKDHPATWWVRARTYSKTADAAAQGRTLSGLHGEHILYLLDESGDIGVPVLNTAEQGLSNCKFGKILQAGNPTSTTGILYECVNQQSDRWTVVRISGDPSDPKRSDRIDKAWAQQQIDTYGRDNPWVMAFVLGLFPPGGLNTLLGPDEVRAAIGRHIRESEYSNVQKRIGVDCARFGDDRTVLFPRQGLAAFAPVELRGQTGPEIAARIAKGKARWGSEVEFIDGTGGYGASTIDQLTLAGLSPVPVNFSSRALDPRYFNRRSEMYFLAAEWVKRGGCLPTGFPGLVAEACAATYSFEGGKFRVIEKDQIKKELGRSPDLWDAFVLTFAMPDMPRSIASILPGQTQGQVQYDYDPLMAA